MKMNFFPLMEELINELDGYQQCDNCQAEDIFFALDGKCSECHKPITRHDVGLTFLFAITIIEHYIKEVDELMPVEHKKVILEALRNDINYCRSQGKIVPDGEIVRLQTFFANTGAMGNEKEGVAVVFKKSKPEVALDFKLPEPMIRTKSMACVISSFQFLLAMKVKNEKSIVSAKSIIQKEAVEKKGKTFLDKIKGLFDFLKPKPDSQEVMFKRMSREMFPNGDEQIEQETSDLRRGLSTDYSLSSLKQLYVFISGLYYLSSTKKREDIVNSILRYKHLQVSAHDAGIIFNFLNNKWLKQKIGVLDSERVSGFSSIENEQQVILSHLENKARAGTSGLAVDEMPESHGEFGLVKTNPVPINGFTEVYTYLSRLQTIEGKEIKFERLGGVTAANVANTIDKFAVYHVNGNFITHIFLSGYQRKTSDKVPLGFKFKT